MERAVEYCENKKSDGKLGQVSLFENSGVQEFATFTFNQSEDYPILEKLRKEKELIGFYISGHPLDPYRTTIARSVTLSSGKMQLAQSGKDYVMLGTVKELKTITTKKGSLMAFAKLEDMEGITDITQTVGNSKKSSKRRQHYRYRRQSGFFTRQPVVFSRRSFGQKCA